MGYLSALDMAHHTDLETAVSWHLSSNHYPPVPQAMVEPCLAAIDAVDRGHPAELVELPAGVSWRGEITAPAWAVVEGHHLEPFLSEES